MLNYKIISLGVSPGSLHPCLRHKPGITIGPFLKIGCKNIKLSLSNQIFTDYQ